MNIIFGYKAEPHITAQQLRNTYIGIFGEGVHILDTGSKLAATVVSATQVDIADGVMIGQGCTATIEHGETESLTIANGSQGMLRKDLIVARYTKASGTGVESMSLAVITGTPASASPAIPSYNTGAIADGDTPIDFPLYVVNLDGISITSVEALADIIGINSAIEDVGAQLTALRRQVNEVMTDYMVRVDVPLGACTCAPNTGTVDAYVDISSNIPTGYKAIDVHCTLTQSNEFYVWKCDFNNTARTEVNLKLQKRSGIGGTIYPWISVICVKDLS